MHKNVILKGEHQLPRTGAIYNLYNQKLIDYADGWEQVLLMDIVKISSKAALTKLTISDREIIADIIELLKKYEKTVEDLPEKHDILYTVALAAFNYGFMRGGSAVRHSKNEHPARRTETPCGASEISLV